LDEEGVAQGRTRRGQEDRKVHPSCSAPGFLELRGYLQQPIPFVRLQAGQVRGTGHAVSPSREAPPRPAERTLFPSCAHCNARRPPTKQELPDQDRDRLSPTGGCTER